MTDVARAQGQSAQRTGAQTEQRVDTAFALLGPAACLLPHHPETKWIRNQWLRVAAGPVDRTGWIETPPTRSDPARVLPVCVDIKHVRQEQRLYQHDAKQAHQLQAMLTFSRPGRTAAGILIVHDTPHVDGGVWHWVPVETAADAQALITGVALRDRLATHRPVPRAAKLATIRSLPVPWYGLPEPREFLAFIAGWVAPA